MLLMDKVYNQKASPSIPNLMKEVKHQATGIDAERQVKSNVLY